MTGLLSQFAEFAKTPEGQGLLSAAFGGLAGAQRGAPLNSIGRAGLAGLAGYSGALDRQDQQANAQFQNQYRTMQMDALKQQQAKQKAEQAWRAGLTDVLKQMQPTYGAGDEGPTMTPGNPNAVNDYLMRPDSPFLDDLMKQQLFPKAEDYRVVGSDLVKIGKDGVTVAHQSQRPDNLPSEQKLYNLAREQGYKGSFMDFLRDRVSTTEGAKANFDLVEITTPDGKTYKVPRSTAAGMAGGGSSPSPMQPQTAPRKGGNFSGPGYAGGSAAAAASDQLAILTREREAALRAGRTQDVAALDREIARLPGGAQAPGIQVQGEAERAAAVERAKDEASGRLKERESAKDAQRASIDSQIAVIDKALNHPGRETATGLSGVLDPRNYLAGTNAKNFQVVLDQLGGAAFLQAFESLKGGGAITEVEGKKATDAIARLNRAQSDEEFKSSLVELRGIMDKARQRIGGGASAAWSEKPSGPTQSKPVPQAAINELKMRKGDPAARQQFDAVFGAGAAARVLGGQ